MNNNLGFKSKISDKSEKAFFLTIIYPGLGRNFSRGISSNTGTDFRSTRAKIQITNIAT